MNLKFQVIVFGVLALSCSVQGRLRHFAETKTTNAHGATVVAKTGIEGLKEKYSIKTDPIKNLKLFVAQSKESGSHVKLGANPNHEEAVGIDSVASESWIAKAGCVDKKTTQPFQANPLGTTTSVKPVYECKNSCKYVMQDGAKVTKSVAIHQSSLSGGLSIKGNAVKDSIILGKITLADADLIEATEISNGATVHTLGGLSFGKSATSIPKILKDKKITTKAVWSSYFFRLHDVPSTLNTKSDYNDIGRGFMTLGEALPIPDKYFEKYNVPSGTTNWILNLAAVTLGAKNLFKDGDFAIFTTNHQSISVPEVALKDIKAEILAKGGFTASDCTADLNNFSCNACKDKAGSLPTFNFQFGAAQHSWSLKPEDYAFFESADKCQFQLSSSGLANTWTLGHYFMKRHYIVFDQDNSQVSLSTFPEADLQILTGYYANLIWNGAFGLVSGFAKFFGIVALAFFLLK